MRSSFRITVFALLLGPLSSSAQTSGVLGNWREPTGSVIRVATCGSDVCATLVAIRHDAPSLFDVHNPDASEHSHPLCGLVIGKGFHQVSADQADGGTLYDPKSGKTYRGEMTAQGDQLRLRGYIGVKLFGRTETWTRVSAPPPCPRT